MRFYSPSLCYTLSFQTYTIFLSLMSLSLSSRTRTSALSRCLFLSVLRLSPSLNALR